MVDNRTRERLTGAAILVAVVVLLVPELLSRPQPAAPRPVAAVDEAPVRSYTLSLGETQQSTVPAKSPAPVPAKGAPAPVATKSPPAPVADEVAAPATAERPAAGAGAAAAKRPVAVEAKRPVAVEAKRSAPVASSAPSESTAHGWAVQVGSFGNRGNADRLVHRLKLKGYGAFVTESPGRGRTWYRVRVGPVRDRAAADALAGRLRAGGLRGAVAQPR